MKVLSVTIALVSLAVTLLWVAVGGVILTIAVGVLVLVIALLGAFGLGSWWSSRLLEQGARIALEAQLSDDRRDTIQVKALTGLMRDTLKARNGSPQTAQYPALTFGTQPESTNAQRPADAQYPLDIQPIDASFTVSGLDDEE